MDYNVRRDQEGNTYVTLSKDIQKKLDHLDFKIRFKKSKLSNFILDYDITQYIGVDKNKNLSIIQDYINNFDGKKNLYLWSKQPATQKTTIASYIGKSLVEKKFTVRFCLMNSLINLLRKYQDFNVTEDVKEEYHNILSCDFLIIDDCFDPKKVLIYQSGFQLPFVDSFLRERLELLCKATCFTSNFSLNNIDKKVYGEYLISLVKRNIHYNLNFIDVIDDNTTMIEGDYDTYRKK